jgi:hypothetical protein
MPERSNEKDWITPAYAIKAAEFVTNSDFQGMRRDAADKTKMFGSLLGAVVQNTLFKSTIKPAGPPAVQTRDVVGQDPALVERNLGTHGITVDSKEEFDASKAGPEVLTAFPARLQPGDKVKLYTEAGQVKYYAIVRPKAPADIRAEDVARLEGDVSTLRTEVRVVDAVRTDLDRVKSAVDANQTNVTTEVAALRDRIGQTEAIRTELQTLRDRLAEREQTIVALKQQVDTLQAAQTEFQNRVTPDMVIRLRTEVDRLEEFRRRTEPHPP